MVVIARPPRGALNVRSALAQAGLVPAMAAATQEMNVVILNLELVRFHLRPGDAVEARVLNVNNAPASQANQVMMLVELGIEARRRTRVAGPGHQPQRNECP